MVTVVSARLRTICLVLLASIHVMNPSRIPADPIEARWRGFDANWSLSTAWSPLGVVPNNSALGDYAAVIAGGTVTTDIPVVLSRLTVNSGGIHLIQPLNTQTMTILNGVINGPGRLHISGDLILLGGVINNTAGSADGFIVDGAVIKRGIGRATLAPFASEGDYDVAIEQGKLTAPNGGLGSRAGVVRVVEPQFARLELSGSTAVEDDVYLHNSRGFGNTGALINGGVVMGDLFLGDTGAVVGFNSAQVLPPTMSFFGGIHGGTLEVTGRGIADIRSTTSALTGRTIIGADGTDASLHIQQAGTLQSTSGFEVGGHATLRLGNTATQNSDRISDEALILLNGGTLELAGDETGSRPTVSEWMGTLQLGHGASTIRLQDRVSEVRFQRLERSEQSTINFRSTGVFAERKIQFVEPPTNVDNIVGAWATARTDFATYHDTLGLIPLDDHVPRPANINTAGPTDHVLVVGTQGNQTLTQNRIVGTLNFVGGGNQNLDLGGHVFTLRQGGLIGTPFTGVSTLVHNGQLTVGTGSDDAELYLYNGLNIGASIVDNPSGGTVSVVKSGDFDVTLSGTNSYSGSTVVQEGSLIFLTQGALPDGSELIVDAGVASFQYEPAGVKHIKRVTLRQNGEISGTKATSVPRTVQVLNAEQFVLEAGALNVTIAGTGVVSKVTGGVAEIASDSPDFHGTVSIHEGVLVAGSQSVTRTPLALGTGETVVMPGGTLMHAAVGPVGATMLLDANLHLAGGDVGIGLVVSSSLWEFDGSWRVTEPSRLLLFDPLGIDEIPAPTVNLRQPATLCDQAELTVLGTGLALFSGGILVAGEAAINADVATVRIDSIRSAGDQSTIRLRGAGTFELPLMLSTAPGKRLMVELAPGTSARPGAEQLIIGDDVTLVVNGQFANVLPVQLTGGTIVGDGQLGDLENVGGTLAPGNSIGVLTVGDYVQGSAGRISAEVFGGINQASDQLRTETAHLGGTIEAVLLSGPPIAIGETFNLIVANGRITVTNLTLETRGFVGSLRVTTLSTGADAGKQALQLVVVPEPITCISVITVAACATLRRHRHRRSGSYR